MNLVFLRHPLLSQFLDPTLWSLILTIGPDPWSGFSMAIIWVYFPVCVHWLNEDHSSYHEIGKIMGNVVRIEWGYSPEPVSAAAVKTSFSCSQLSNNGCSCVCDVVRLSNWLDSGLGNLTMCDVAFHFPFDPLPFCNCGYSYGYKYRNKYRYNYSNKCRFKCKYNVVVSLLWKARGWRLHHRTSRSRPSPSQCLRHRTPSQCWSCHRSRLFWLRTRVRSRSLLRNK